MITGLVIALIVMHCLGWGLMGPIWEYNAVKVLVPWYVGRIISWVFAIKIKSMGAIKFEPCLNRSFNFEKNMGNPYDDDMYVCDACGYPIRSGKFDNNDESFRAHLKLSDQWRAFEKTLLYRILKKCQVN